MVQTHDTVTSTSEELATRVVAAPKSPFLLSKLPLLLLSVLRSLLLTQLERDKMKHKTKKVKLELKATAYREEETRAADLHQGKWRRADEERHNNHDTNRDSGYSFIKLFDQLKFQYKRSMFPLCKQDPSDFRTHSFIRGGEPVAFDIAE